MKKLIFAAALAMGMAARIYGQGILIDNTLNSNPSPSATSGGLVWTNVNGQLGLFDGLDFDVAMEVYAGSDSNNLAYVATIYPGDTNGTAYTGYDFGHLQSFPTGLVCNTGVTPGAMAWVELKMWWWEMGPYFSYNQALSNQTPACDIVFQNPTGNPNAPPTGPQTLTGMPAAILQVLCTSQTTSPITQQPTNEVANPDGTATFSVVVSGATGYQWLFNGDAIAGQTSSILGLTNIQPANSGFYSVVVYGCPTQTSSNAFLTVACDPPTISQPPTNEIVVSGSQATFSVAADRVYGYQWLFDGTNISGANSSTLTLSNVQVNESGMYSVIVYGCGSDVTNYADLTVDCESPTISLQPSSQSVAAGFTVTFSVTASPAFGYQWLFNGANISGANSATLTLSNLKLTNAGAYSVVIEGCSNNITSSNAILTVLTSPFPLSAGQRGTVTCLENPAITYDVFLPPGYSTNGPPLPILYTFAPNGGGMVSSFLTAAGSMNIILVGLTGSQNSWPWNPVLKEMYAVARDVRRRVLFDPTAEFASGLSGGGENTYIFSRMWSQHVAGVLPMGGWLGNINFYFSTDRVQTNLLVARTTGTSDTATLFYNPIDSNYLASCGAVVQDWIFPGGHETAPVNVQEAALQWLLTNRIPAGVSDRSNSEVLEANWRSRMAAGDNQSVLCECISNLMSLPRSWFALRAQFVLDDLMTNYASFQSIDVSNIYPASTAFITNRLCFTNGTTYDYTRGQTINNFVGVNYWSQSDFAYDVFYYLAHGAATNHDTQRYDCALKTLTGIPGVNGDRDGDLNYVLNKFKYPGPEIQISPDSTGTQMNIFLLKNVPTLSYSVRSRTGLMTGVWQNLSLSAAETDTGWSAETPFNPQARSAFFQMVTTPLSGVSPPWPDDGGIGF